MHVADDYREACDCVAYGKATGLKRVPGLNVSMNTGIMKTM